MKENITFKEQFYYGLNLLKKDIEDCKNNKLYAPFIKNFSYPLSSIEKEVENAIINHEDTEPFYKDKCEKIEKLYFRLAFTSATISEEFYLHKGKVKKRSSINKLLNNRKSLKKIKKIK